MKRLLVHAPPLLVDELARREGDVAALHYPWFLPAPPTSGRLRVSEPFDPHVKLDVRAAARLRRVLAMLKPDVAKDSATVNGIKAMIDGAGLTIEREERCRLSRRQCETFYAEHAERSFFPDLVRFMSSGPVIKLELSGSDAVKRWRTLLGPTNSAVAREKAPKSVRALFGTDQQRNAAHGSVSNGRNRKS
jgi:nucleoside-diphosphate kinase